MVKALRERIMADRPRLAPLGVWRAYAHLDEYKGEGPLNDLTALVALLRRVAGLDETLTQSFRRACATNYKNWIMRFARRHARPSSRPSSRNGYA